MTAETRERMSNYRWGICSMLFLATTVNYLDRQVLSLTWKDFIAPEFHWTDAHYGQVAAVFGLIYAVANLFNGRLIDRIGTKKGYLLAIGVWSLGACLHAVCGWATKQTLGHESINEMVSATGLAASTIAMVSSYYFIAARIILAVGEGGNFPAAIKVTAEYFPKKDRAFATAIFNAGTTIGALAAPLSIPTIARYFQSMGVGNGWEMAFLLIGGLGFLWMGLWIFLYQHPRECKYVNKQELAYIEQDSAEEPVADNKKEEKSMSFLQCLRYKQTWAIFFGKFITDGVWWFFLFWTPAYLSDVYNLPSDNPTAQFLIFVLYAITILSIFGGKLPTIIINRTRLNAYDARMRAMLIFAVIPLVTLFAQPLGVYSYWFPIILIGIAGAAHQSWSANLFSVIGDMFPKSTIATITGINGLAGGLSSFLINIVSGYLFDYAAQTNMKFMGFEGKPAGYFIIFCYCAVAYIAGWAVMKILVPRYKNVECRA